MRQITVNIYRYKELSDKAKEQARLYYGSLEGYIHANEAFASIEALAKHFGGEMCDFNVDFFDCSYSWMHFAMPHEYEPGELLRLVKKLGKYNPETLRGVGECVLTGWRWDEDAIDGLRKAFMEGERDIQKLMQAAFKTWVKSCQDDCDHFYSDIDGDFADHCEANGFEFTEDGKFYYGG